MAGIWGLMLKDLRLTYALLICFMVILAAGFISRGVPFNPMTVYDKDPLPTEVCPNDPIAVFLDYEINDSNAEYTITSNTYWMPEEGGRPQGADTATFTTGEVERGVYIGSQSRNAPIEPGNWILHTDYVIKGHRLLLPRTQVVAINSEDVTTVVDIDDPRCEGRIDALKSLPL